ncbi:E3 ubiquitin-protein ligase DA2L-like [Nymphaea colorata]|nr:E3 ubiquitin-protein ligase DA2L-like [Nymphaea colorata]XP_031473306.1 E3 ubiquitin-protein ligase DA2L-like [Nymphaea colorata]XP_031473307.1 E3 ubiquitin-protein ligase DA2L-like [Nymphaea colorata]XP_031473308.1 E3 ubiquitin-protein ligase DA2L-like [Nymphaea colorata]
MLFFIFFIFIFYFFGGMGNKLVKKRQVVDERYTRPQGLYQLSKDVDHKKLRKLILESKLAPCYPGADERGFDLEECPICLMYYPSLNRSKCCMKGICTECFLQMKPSHSTCPEQCTRCPFCKASNYAVEYRGFKTKEEKGMEQIEEQKVIEAKIRMQQQELLDEQERQQGRQERCPMHQEIEHRDVTNSASTGPVPSSMPVSIQNEGMLPLQRQPVHTRQNRDEGFDVDLEDIMLMEAIWLSIQEQDGQMNVPYEQPAHSRGSGLEYQHTASDFAPREPSPSAGLASAIASMAERQIMDAESASSQGSNEQIRSRYIASLEGAGISTTRLRVQGDWIDVSSESGRPLYGGDAGWMTDQRPKVAEASTSNANSQLHSVSGATTECLPSMQDLGVRSDFSIPTEDGGIVPESFEEQMMLAMAISLAEARGQPALRGSWD